MGGKAALIFVLGFSFLMGYTIMNLNTAGTRAVGNMATYTTMTASHNLALAGANLGLAKLYRDTSWGSSGTATINQTLNTGSLIGSISVSASRTGDTKTVRCYSAYPDNGKTYRDTIEVTLGKNINNSFTLFAWMTNVENGVFWITGDTVWGRVHSNDNLTVSGSPAYFAKVTTSKGFIPPVGKTKNGYTNNAKFYNPPQPETGVARIDIPSDLSDLAAAAAAAKGKKYNYDIWVTLDGKTAASGDGMAYIRKTQNGSPVDSIRLNDTASFNGVIMGTGVVNVQGTVDGKLTIASYNTPTATTNNLVVQGNIVYEQNPRIGASDDQLGLVANNNVIVADNLAAGANLSIDGSIFTRLGSFTAENYNTRSKDGQLRVYGSIVQNIRGAVGTFSGSTISTGFLKAYRYDNRLLDPTKRPPFYPGWLQKNYAILNWYESYKIMDFQ